MKHLGSKIIVLSILLGFSISCKENRAEGKWIKGSQQEQIEAIEWQFRGFDKAMVETDYRYQNLYWAGTDQNWEYADYLNKKIRKAIETGLARRPARAASAQHFLTVTLPEMQQVIDNKDSIGFSKTFSTMTLDCNTCHSLEKLPFFTVKTPVVRQSSIR